MSFSLPPATPPQPKPFETIQPPQQLALPPTSDDITPPPTPIIQTPSPSLLLSPPPPSPSPQTPSPLLALPPLLPIVVPTLPPLSPPLLPSVSPQPQPQPQPQPPIIPPTKHIPPPTFTIISPPLPKMSTPTKTISPPPPPLPLLRSPVPPMRQQKHVPTTAKPEMPAVKQTTSGPTNSSSKATPAAASASAVLPTQPPVALPVPQTPGGGAWFPDASAPTSIMPTIPGALNSPLSVGTQVGQVSSRVPNSGGSSGFAVGLVVGGVLLLLLGLVFAILVVLCRRNKKNTFGDHGDPKLHASACGRFQDCSDKYSLPRYTKQGPKIPVNATTSEAHSPVIAGLTHLSSGTFSYDELIAATSGFSDQNLLGQGGFGYVHKGVLPNGKEVAVKQLRMGGDQGEREFQAEVDTISQVHHKHLVSLVGYCISGPERLLVYEFVANDTLDFHLHGKEQPVMDWPTRLKIAIGSAKGLAYLHEDCSPSIIHRDIKAANILLDFNFEAKVSDFGLAKIFSSTNPSVTHMTTRVVGTFGYLAPEYASSGKVTDKSDIYSYGVVLLELITGRPPISNFGPATNGSLVNWARPLLAQAIADGNFDTLADPRLQNNYNVDEMVSMVSCAAACVRLSSWRRPRMSQVIRALEGNLSASELDDGVKAGHGPMHFPYESVDYDARDYIDNMKRMALVRRYSDNTSDYGLNHSISSTDTTQLIG
ncbi:hypothetical protein KSS87_000306 [Heliosperma pusillum]|nr:hypothetical protein KSS87_000306 [Heliosperma pusillum]